MVTVFSLVEVETETARPGFMSRSRRVLGIGRMTYPDFHLLQAKESQFQLQFLGVYYGGKIKVAKIYYIDIFVYIYNTLILMKICYAEFVMAVPWKSVDNHSPQMKKAEGIFPHQASCHKKGRASGKTISSTSWLR